MSGLFLPLVKSPETGNWYIPILAKVGTRADAEQHLAERAEDFAAVGRQVGTTGIFRLTEVAT